MQTWNNFATQTFKLKSELNNTISDKNRSSCVKTGNAADKCVGEKLVYCVLHTKMNVFRNECVHDALVGGVCGLFV